MKLHKTNHPVALAPRIPKGPKDRPLSLEEETALNKAEKFPKGKFSLIKPIPGTIGFILRNVNGGNPTIIEYLKAGLEDKGSGKGAIATRIKALVDLWIKLDEYSKNRVDYFDWFCKKYSIPKGRLLGYITEGMFHLGESETMIDLIESKPELVNNVRQFARAERNFRDRELLAKATKLTNETAGVIVDASTKVTNNNLVLETGSSNFRDIIRNSDKEVVGEVNFKQLTEGNTDFIEAEIIHEDQLELVEM